MTNHVDFDPYFDDEDEANEENYRQLLRARAPVPPCDANSLPVTTLDRLCLPCSRAEAENILKTSEYRRPGNFIVRPSVYPHHPYSLSVLAPGNIVFHFQIAHVLHQYCIGPWDQVNQATAKMFPSLRALIDYYLEHPLHFEDDQSSSWECHLTIYGEVTVTQF